MPQPINISAIIGYTVSALTSTLGILVLAGMFIPEAVPSKVRITFGAVIVLLGIYRFVITRVRLMQSRRDAHD